MGARIACLLCLLPLPLFAQAPMSAIDWLDDNQPSNSVPDVPDASQPYVSQGALRPEISVTPLDVVQSDSVGLLPSRVTGLPVSLWRNSQTDTLKHQLERLEISQNPAIQQLTFSLLLAEADAPSDSNGKFEFLAARVQKLVDYGAIDPALALVERAAPLPAPMVPVLFDLSLLTDALDPACDQVLQLGSRYGDEAARIYCFARKGDWLTAVLVLETAEALGRLTPRIAALLHLFLETDSDNVLAANMPPNLAPSPLEFRLYEAIGEPLSPSVLVRAFSVSQLSGENGWHAQLRAAERLAETGALSDNRLLGIYSLGTPAASGSVWDRARAITRLEKDLKSGDKDAIVTSFQTAKGAFEDGKLSATFARLFVEPTVLALDISQVPIAVLETGFLTPEYEKYAGMPALDSDPNFMFRAAIARGDLSKIIPQSDIETAISQAFLEPRIHHSVMELLSQGRLGEVILNAIAQFEKGSSGDLQDLMEALSTLRHVGLEDTARRAALSYLAGL